MSLTNAWIVSDCDIVLDWLAASSIAVDRQLRSIGRWRRWTCGAWHRLLCLLIEVSERWRRQQADSPLPGNQVSDQSSTRKTGRCDMVAPWCIGYQHSIDTTMAATSGWGPIVLWHRSSVNAEHRPKTSTRFGSATLQHSAELLPNFSSYSV